MGMGRGRDRLRVRVQVSRLTAGIGCLMTGYKFLPGHRHAHRGGLAGNNRNRLYTTYCILYFHGLRLFLYMMSYDISTLPFSYTLRI